MQNLEINDTNKLIYTTNILTDLENKFMVPGGWREGIVREVGLDMYPLLHLKWIANKDLLYSTGNSA